MKIMSMVAEKYMITERWNEEIQLIKDEMEPLEKIVSNIKPGCHERINVNAY